MFKKWDFYCVMSLLLIAGNVFSERAVIPFKGKNEIILWDADKNSEKDFINYTTVWKKGSDMMPQLTTVESENGKWLKFSYTGSRGSGISKLDIEKEKLSQMLPDGTEFSGIKLLIDYKGAEFEKIELKTVFTGENDFIVSHTPLEKGIKEYTLTKGFRRADFPPDWTKLKYIWLCSDKSDMTFMLKKVSMITRKSENKNISLKINSVKKVQEIFPARNGILKDGTIDESCVESAASLHGFCFLKDKQEIEDKNSPLKAKIVYDENYLCMVTEAEFPMKPIANVKKKDDDVYQDEALEYFFSTWNDNNRKIQFVTNFEGVFFDSIRDYDLTAADIINSSQWDLPHIKKISYENGVWKTLFAVSFKDLKMDLNKCRFMGFQLAQDYSANNNSGKYKTLSWAPTASFPNPLDFGILVFNKKSFGNGDIEIKEILSRKKSVGNEIDLSVKFSGKNFKEGEYKVETIVVAADYTSIKSMEKIKFSGEEKNETIRISSVKSINGNYTVYVCVYNENNDMKIAAVNFENVTPLKDMFGENILWPMPKKVIWGDGVFMAGNANKILIPENASARMIRTADIFKNKLYGFAGSKYSVSKNAIPEKNSISLKISKETVFDGKKVDLRSEGYCVDVRPDGVNITGADEAGLYYGCVTFIQLLKIPMKIVDGMPVKSVKILDWPDLPNRLVRIEHPWHFRNKKFKEVPKIEYLMDWTERFVAENKFNRLWLDISMLIKFERQPEFNGSERVFSLDDCRKFGEFCRDHFIEVIPVFEVGGHANWWLLEYHPELKEKGYPHQSDITHPEHNKIVFNCILDVIETMKPKYISPKTDEWWHSKGGNEVPDELLRGKTRAEAFLDFHVELNDWLKKRNVKMQIYEDMLNPRHNGKRYDVYKVIDKFPKDIIITPWSGGMPDVTSAYFLDKGFEVWGNTTAYWTYGDKIKSRVQGMGFGTYNLGTDWRLYNTKSSTSIYGIFMGADNAWNILRKKEAPLMDEIASGKLPALREMYALRPNPAASAKVTPLNIQKNMDCSSLEYLCKKGQECAVAEGLQNVGNIPMLFSNQKMNCIVLGKDKTMSVPVGKICSSLLFLHTIAAVDEQGVKDFNGKGHWRNWPYGYVLGDYQVYYDDGTVEKMPVRLFWNIGITDINPLYRTTNDNRYVMPLKTSDGGYRFLYQWEWVNPHPDKKIETITYVDNKEFNFKILLFAISCRDKK